MLVCLLSRCSLSHARMRGAAEESEADAAKLLDKEARISQLQGQAGSAASEAARLAAEAAKVGTGLASSGRLCVFRESSPCP